MTQKHEQLQTMVRFCIIIVLVVGTSLGFSSLWGGKPETMASPGRLVISEDMTVSRFGQVNKLPDSLLKKSFGLSSATDLDRKLSEFGSPETIASTVAGKQALAAEKASKNWLKIRLKFVAWLVFLSFVFFYLRRRTLAPGRRMLLLGISVLVFGIVLGADPGPMGTVKDAIHLYGTAHVIFPPRMIALAVFLLLVFLANKFICAWGCQAGTLQELIFRLNTNDRHEPRIGRHIKVPFVVTNTCRVLFFCVFVLGVFLGGIDIIAPIDPFRIYNPASLALAGGTFIGVLLLLSLFMYRPWCHLFCPFGLAGWVVEKFSRVRISVDYRTCIACRQCAAACPSTVMGAILYRNRKTIPDCFACYTCRDICPTKSIRFSLGKRTLPPTGHFTKNTAG